MASPFQCGSFDEGINIDLVFSAVIAEIVGALSTVEPNLVDSVLSTGDSTYALLRVDVSAIAVPARVLPHTTYLQSMLVDAHHCFSSRQGHSQVGLVFQDVQVLRDLKSTFV